MKIEESEMSDNIHNFGNQNFQILSKIMKHIENNNKVCTKFQYQQISNVAMWAHANDVSQTEIERKWKTENDRKTEITVSIINRINDVEHLQAACHCSLE